MDGARNGARVTICGACRNGAGAALARAVGDLVGEAAEVRLAPCLLGCGRPLALAVEAPAKGAYVFAGVDPATAAEGLAAFVRLFAGAPGGEVRDARPCGDLRFRLIARLPP